MAVKKSTPNTTDKILNSDIYDITAFVDDIKKINIDGVNNPQETLQVGMYGYLGYEFAAVLQNSIVVASELANEAIPTRAKFDRNVITHALSLGIKKVQATAATMRVMLMFPEKALNVNMVNDRFVLKASTPIYFDDLEFHTDYDIVINKTKLDSSTIGSRAINYVYTGVYDMRIPNTESDIENAYLPPIAVFAGDNDNIVAVSTVLHQVEYNTYEQKIVGNDNISNKTINFTFENQLSHFTVTVYENNDRNKAINLIPYYDGLYHNPYTDRHFTQNREDLNNVIINEHVYDGQPVSTEVVEEKYCYYQYINSNTIRIRFDPESYQPTTNANVEITIWTSHGYAGNFDRVEDLTVRLTSDEYTNLYMTVKQRGDEGSYGGIDRKSVPELQKIIPKEALSRGSVTTLTDLRNYFNSINNEDSVLHVFRKEDNLLNRLYYTYSLMKDADNNVVPTNTIPVHVSRSEESVSEDSVGDMYIESGEPLYLYKKSASHIPFMRTNYIGYTDYVDSVVTEIASVTGPYNDSDQSTIIKGGDIWYYENDMHIHPNVQDRVYKNFNDFIKKELIEGDGEKDIDPHRNIYIFESGRTVKFSVTAPYSPQTPSTFVKKETYVGTVVSFGYFGDNTSQDDPGYRNAIVQGGRNPVYLKLIVDTKDDNGDEKQIKILLPYNAIFTYPPEYLANKPIIVNKSYIYGSDSPVTDMKFIQGGHVRFCLYKENEDTSITLADPDNWHVGEVLAASNKYDTATTPSTDAVTILYNVEDDTSTRREYRTDTFKISSSILNTKTIIGVEDITNFTYTSPMSILLRDNKVANGHRVDASYFLDMISETRYMDYSHINSASPIQYISSYVKVDRPSWISKYRYKYTIVVDMAPNISTLSDEMKLRTQVIAVYYDDNNMNMPIGYSIGKLINASEGVLSYEFELYTKGFKPRQSTSEAIVINERNKLYIGQQNPYVEDEEYDPNFLYIPGTDDPIVDARFDLNTHMRLYMLYKYSPEEQADPSIKNDNLSLNYFSSYNDSLATIIGKVLTSIVPEDTVMYEGGDEVESYTLKDMILTNVYDSHDGINLLHNYSNLMNSYVHMINETTTEGKDPEISYIVNRVPCIRYFYLNTEDKIDTFIREMKRKIIYVLDAIDPLETTFGIDYKLFNTYGPSKMYYITKGGVKSEETIDNVAITMTFRTQFYNEDNDAATILPQIKDTIKQYMENIEELNDLHFPNLTTMIETTYSQYILFFEYVSFNIYDATMQHIITDEDMERLSIVPEFLNVNTDDTTGLPFINIEIVS